MKVRGQLLDSEAKMRGIILGLVVKNSFILIIDLLFQCWTKLKVNIKIFISTPLRGTPQEGFMKAYTISTKLSSSARETRENKISSHFQLNKKPVIFEAVRIEENILFEKSYQTYFLKKWSVSNFFKHFVINLCNKIFLWRFWR